MSNDPKHLGTEEFESKVVDQLIDEDQALELALIGDDEFFQAIDDVIAKKHFIDQEAKYDAFHYLMKGVAIVKQSQHIDNAANLVEEAGVFMNVVIEQMMRNRRVEVLGFE